MFYGPDLTLNLLTLKRSAKAGWKQYVQDNWPFLSYNFEIAADSDIRAASPTKCPKLAEDILLEIPFHKVVLLKVESYASTVSCRNE